MRSRIGFLLLSLTLLAVPAAADVFHVTLRNGTEIETSRQPEQASWDPSMVLLLTEVGNWVGFPKDEIESIRADDPTSGYGVRINDNVIALGWSPNDLPAEAEGGRNEINDRITNIAERMLELTERQQRYSIDQGVQTEQSQGIPASFGGYAGGSSSGFGSIPLEPSPDRFVEPQDRISNPPGSEQ
jgi:hypothetical protein